MRAVPEAATVTEELLRLFMRDYFMERYEEAGGEGLGRAAFAKMLGISSHHSVSQVVNQERDISWELYLRLSKAFAVSPSQLVFELARRCYDYERGTAQPKSKPLKSPPKAGAPARGEAIESPITAAKAEAAARKKSSGQKKTAARDPNRPGRQPHGRTDGPGRPSRDKNKLPDDEP